MLNYYFNVIEKYFFRGLNVLCHCHSFVTWCNWRSHGSASQWKEPTLQIRKFPMRKDDLSKHHNKTDTLKDALTHISLSNSDVWYYVLFLLSVHEQRWYNPAGPDSTAAQPGRFHGYTGYSLPTHPSFFLSVFLPARSSHVVIEWQQIKSSPLIVLHLSIHPVSTVRFCPTKLIIQ